MPGVRHPTAHNRLRFRRHLEFPFSTTYLAQVSNSTDEKKSSGETEDKIIAIARKSPSVSIPQIAEILGISTRAVEKQIRQLKQAKRLRRIGPAKGRKLASRAMKTPADANPHKARSWVRILVILPQVSKQTDLDRAHRDLPVYGVQFYPESVLTQHGKTMLGNFLEL